jgi:GGDEF domain-containing protein
MLVVDDFNPITATRPDTGSPLRCVAHALRESARADDLVARYGGEEEFVLLMSSDLEPPPSKSPRASVKRWSANAPPNARLL